MDPAESPAAYRKITLVDQDPPDEIKRHADMIPGESGRYGKIVRYRHDASKTIYEVLHFMAGRPPTREEVIADLRADLAEIDKALRDIRKTGRFSSWVDRTFFSGASRAELDKKRNDILETIRSVQEDYEPGEAVKVP